MGDVSKAIERYIRVHITLNLPDISRSARSRDWLLGRISGVVAQRKEDGKKEPVLYASKPFLNFGSYFKKTKVKVVDEYDILVVIDSNGGMFSTDGSKLGDGQGSANPNYKYEGRKYHKSDDSGVSPTKMLNWLKGIVAEIFEITGGEVPVRNGQAITVFIKSTNTTIDLVPAGIFKRVSDEKIFYNIPRGDKSDGWITTAPEDDMAALKEVARDKDDFRNVVRICKRVKDTYNFQVTSFAIETIVVSFGNKYKWRDDLYRDCRGALWYVAQVFREGTISDPFSGQNLIAGVEKLNRHAERIEKIIDTLDKCMEVADQARVEELVTKAFENVL